MDRLTPDCFIDMSKKDPCFVERKIISFICIQNSMLEKGEIISKGPRLIYYSSYFFASYNLQTTVATVIIFSSNKQISIRM